MSSQQELLLDELEEIFLQEGYRDVTFRALAARLECSNRKLYAVAPSKEALFVTVISRFFSKVKKQGWKFAASEKPLAERIEEYLHVGILAAERAGTRFNEDIAGSGPGRALFDEFQSERISGLKDLIQEGIDNGEFDGFHAHLVAEVMIQSARRIREPTFLAQADISFAEGLSELSSLIRLGLLRR